MVAIAADNQLPRHISRQVCVFLHLYCPRMHREPLHLPPSQLLSADQLSVTGVSMMGEYAVG